MSLSNSFLPYYSDNIIVPFSSAYTYKFRSDDFNIPLAPGVWRIVDGANTPIIIDNFVSAIPAPSTLTYTALQSGLFNIIYNIDGSMLSAPQKLTFGIFINGGPLPVPNSLQIITFDISTDTPSPVTGTSIVNLNSGDTIALYVLCDESDTIINKTMNLSVYSLNV